MNQSSPAVRSSRTALVTGAAQGIGEGVATRLVAEGVRHLVLLDVDERGLERTAAALGAQADGVRVETVTSDLVDIERSCARIDEALERAGRLDILVNAAGITSRGGLDDITLETFDRLMAINVRAPLFVTQAARPYLSRGATVVNVTSMLAYGGPPFLLGYSASKAALVALTKGAANTLKWDGIRVFGINLGWTLTPSEQRVQTEVHGLADDWADTVGAKQPFGRLLMPEDPAALVAFLVSEDARMMTGAIIDLDQFVAGTVDDNPGAST